MNASDYQKLKDIFQSAVEIPPEQRSAYLDEKCDGDVELRSEIERLLASVDDEFLETPAVTPITEPEQASSSFSGQRIGHYSVIKKIGSGGMGDVYLATDGKLGRRVAVKILPEEFTSDQDRLDRFQLEARAASALSHPNILTIHEIGEWEGTHYIATEYVDGETLRSRLSRERLSISEAMDLGIQLALALTAAHESSICHRDIKPENIMIRGDGLLKVVDFGLAKLVASPFRATSSPTLNDEPTVKILNTEPGVIMGTVQYMSPEQTRGLATDERSDIWSLGCVLYEMLTGHAPFAGETSADMVAEIVKSHPELPSRLATDVPERLDEIISKSLEKNPDERYQTAKDLLIDLKRLKRNLELEDTLERSQPRITTDSGDVVISGPNIISTKKGPKDLTEVNSAQYLYWGMKAHRWTAIGITLFVIGLVGGTALLVRYYWRAPAKEPPPFTSNDFVRITNNGRSSKPAISPDGRHIAYVTATGLLSRLVVRQVGTDIESELMPPTKVDEFLGIRFSKDSEFVYFVTVRNDVGTLYRVSKLGGSQKKLLEDIDSNISFSPDGSDFAFVRNSTEEKTSSLLVASSNGSNERIIARMDGHGALKGVAWSPTRDRLLVTVSEESSTSYPVHRTRFATVSYLSGQIKVLDSKVWEGNRDFTWTPDGRGIVFIAQDKDVRQSSVWHMAFPTNSVTLLTNHPDNYSAISNVSENQMLAVERTVSESSLWSLGLLSKKTLQLRGESPDQLGRNGIVEVSDGRFLMTKFESDASSFWLVDRDGTHESKLVDESSYNYHPSISSDGRTLVFISTSTGKARLWRSNSDGKNRVLLSDSAQGAETNPKILPDNNSVVFVRDIQGAWKTELVKIQLNGEGERVIYSKDETAVVAPTVSPDGRFLAFWSIRYTGPNQHQTVLKKSEIRGDDFIETDVEVVFPGFGNPLFPCEWTKSNRLICVGSKDPANVYSLSFDGRSQKLTDFKDGSIYNPKLLSDDVTVLFNRYFSKSDIFTFTNRS